jgi:hypothetical protein
MIHGGGFELMDAVVLAAAGFAFAFLAAWMASPRLRAWVERPKYRFQANVRDYDRKSRG